MADITTDINRPDLGNIQRKNTTATGPGTVQDGFTAAGLWNTGSIAVIIDGQSIPANGAVNFPYTGKQYIDEIVYDATGSTLLITVIY